MLTPTSFASLSAPVAPRSPFDDIKARLAVLDVLLSSKAPQVFHVTLESHPLAFGAPMARAVDWEAFGHAILGTSTVLPNDSRWTNGGAEKRATMTGMRLAVRVNGTSDLPGDAVTLARALPSVQFYDYTKVVQHARAFVEGRLPANLHVTLSYDSATVPWNVCKGLLSRGVNVAVPFAVKKSEDLPSYWRGVPVIDGDAHDLRFLDGARGVVVGLRAKGAARGAAGRRFVQAVES